MDFDFNDVLSAVNQIRGGLPIGRLSTRIRLGDHKSVFYGPSYDFYDIREYDPDRDRASDIIWSLYDHSEKIIWARRTIESHEVNVNLFVDLSSSLDSGLSLYKRKMLLETIGFIGVTAARYQDPFGLVGFTDKIVLNFRPKCGQNNFFHLLKEVYDFLDRHDLSKGKVTGRQTDFFYTLDFIRKFFNRPCFIPVISDFVGFEKVASSSLLRSAASRHELLFIFLDEPSEIQSAQGWGYMNIKDIETGKTSIVRRSKMYKDEEELRLKRKLLRKDLRRIGIDSIVLEYGKHFKRLYRFFTARRSRRRS